MAGVLGWMGEALGFGEDQTTQGGATSINEDQDHITVDDTEVEVFPDNMTTKEQLYDIFSSFKALVTSEDGKARLAKAVENGEPVEDVTQKMQEEVAIKLGLDGPSTVDKFKYVLKFYKDDEVLCEEFIKFCESESLACDEAELGPEKLKEKLANLEINEPTIQQPTASRPGQVNNQSGVHPAQIKQLEMLIAPKEEFEKMIKGMEESMQAMLNKNPRFKELLLLQLKQRGLSNDDDPIAGTIQQCRDAHEALRESVEKEAAAAGKDYKEFILERVEKLKLNVGTGNMAEEQLNAAREKLRFKLGDRVEARITPDGKYSEGTITGTMVGGGQRIMPYEITVRDGENKAYAPMDTNFFVREFGSTEVGTPPPGMQMPQPGAATTDISTLRFKVGDKVECRVTPDGKYASGVIAGVKFETGPGEIMPYQIMLDLEQQLILAPQDTDFYIRQAGGGSISQQPGVSPLPASAPAPIPGMPTGKQFVESTKGNALNSNEIVIEKPVKGTPLRFGVGDRVACRVTPDGQFMDGVVTQLWYREPQFPADMHAPYQVLLKNGMHIFAPADIDQIIRAA